MECSHQATECLIKLYSLESIIAPFLSFKYKAVTTANEKKDYDANEKEAITAITKQLEHSISKQY